MVLGNENFTKLLILTKERSIFSGVCPA